MQTINYFDINDNVNNACFSIVPFRKKEFPIAWKYISQTCPVATVADGHGFPVKQNF